jgi:hypothetical protein
LDLLSSMRRKIHLMRSGKTWSGSGSALFLAPWIRILFRAMVKCSILDPQLNHWNTVKKTAPLCQYFSIGMKLLLCFFTICPSLEACRWCPFRDCVYMWMVRALLLLANTKQTASDWLPIKQHCTGWAKTSTSNFCTKFAISYGFAALQDSGPTAWYWIRKQTWSSIFKYLPRYVLGLLSTMLRKIHFMCYC